MIVSITKEVSESVIGKRAVWSEESTSQFRWHEVWSSCLAGTFYDIASPFSICFFACEKVTSLEDNCILQSFWVLRNKNYGTKEKTEQLWKLFNGISDTKWRGPRGRASRIRKDLQGSEGSVSQSCGHSI